MTGIPKGILGQKSSVLAPTSCKLSQQVLVLQNLNSHYKKLYNAKSAIDTKQPKSLKTNARKRDQHMKKRVSSRLTPRTVQSARTSRDAEYGDKINENWAKYGAGNPRSMQKQLDEAVPSYDILDIHADRFTRPATANASQAGPKRAAVGENGATDTPGGAAGDLGEAAEHSFTPRILNIRSGRMANVKSRIANDPTIYNRPGNAAGASTTNSNGIIARNDERSVRKPPQIKQTSRSKPQLQLSNGKARNDINSQMMSGSAAMRDDAAIFDSHQSQQPTGDQIKWLQDQAKQAQMRKEMLRSRTAADNSYLDVNTGCGFEQEQRFSPRATSSDRSDLRNSPIMTTRLEQQEDELKYIAFFDDVTKDILNRGVYSDRMINAVFEQHVEQNRAKLDSARMRLVLEDIRAQLGMPCNHPPRDHPSREQHSEGGRVGSSMRVVPIEPSRNMTQSLNGKTDTRRQSTGRDEQSEYLSNQLRNDLRINGRRHDESEEWGGDHFNTANHGEPMTAQHVGDDDAMRLHTDTQSGPAEMGEVGGGVGGATGKTVHFREENNGATQADIAQQQQQIMMTQPHNTQPHTVETRAITSDNESLTDVTSLAASKDAKGFVMAATAANSHRDDTDDGGEDHLLRHQLNRDGGAQLDTLRHAEPFDYNADEDWEDENQNENEKDGEENSELGSTRELSEMRESLSQKLNSSSEGVTPHDKKKNQEVKEWEEMTEKRGGAPPRTQPRKSKNVKWNDAAAQRDDASNDDSDDLVVIQP